MEWMILPYKRYADFQGRSCRREYWMFVLFNIVVFAVLGGVTFAGMDWSTMGQPGVRPQVGTETMVGGVLLGLFWLLALIPSIAVHVRRFHDQDRSGWFYLLAFVPYVGGFIVLIFMCLRGTHGPNRFGEDPLDPGMSMIFA